MKIYNTLIADILTLLAMISIISLAMPAEADTVYFKDGSAMKGIVVEGYHDRLVISTIDGEKEIRYGEIKDVKYDRPEQNLVKMGDMYYQKDNPDKAFEYYQKAKDLNPEYKEAKDKFFHLRSVLMKRPEKKIKSDMDRRRGIFMESGKVYEASKTRTAPQAPAEKLKQKTGLVLIREANLPKVGMVVAGSPAEESGIIKGDLIYALWGRLTGYLNLDELIAAIIDSPSPEIAFIVRRDISISADEESADSLREIGFSLAMEEAGLTVSKVTERSAADAYGLKESDIIIEISGEQTRYMPLKEAQGLIDAQLRAGRTKLSILRDAVLWRKD